MNRAITAITIAGIFGILIAWAPSTTYAGGPGVAPSPSCGGKPTTQGTGGDDFVLKTDNSNNVYNMKGGQDVVIDVGGGNDVFRMGDGNDFVASFVGNDIICLGDGNDQAFTDDGNIDVVKCGAGEDSVIVDEFDLVDADCETVTFGGG